MRKQFKKQQEESQIIWKNVQHEVSFNPNKLTHYYGIIKVGDTNYITEYDGKFRSEAEAIFIEESHLSGGTLTTIGTFK